MSYTSGGKSIFYLKTSPDTKYSEYSLVLEIDSPENTMARIFYMSSADKRFTKENKIIVKVTKGKNRLTFYFKSNGLGKLIRIDPGLKFGNYKIHKIKLLAK